MDTSATTIDHAEILQIARTAVQLYAESHPRPVQVTYGQAADMLGIHINTVQTLIKTGILKLNAAGRIPISEIDKALATR